MAGKLIELQELLSSNIILTEPEPKLQFNRFLLLTSLPRKLKWHIEDISTWLEAFTVLQFAQQRVLCGFKRTLGNSSSLQSPITDDVMMVSLGALDLTHQDHCMFQVACNIAYFSFLHSAEFTVPNLASYVSAMPMLQWTLILLPPGIQAVHSEQNRQNPQVDRYKELASLPRD